MVQAVEQHLQNILSSYAEGERYEEMKAAIELFEKVTGKLDEDAGDFETRMNSFNDWFIFNHKKANGKRVIEEYIEEADIEGELIDSFFNINHSLFRFAKINFKKKIVLEDILHSKKIFLEPKATSVALIEEDLFVGRIIETKEGSFLLKGVNTMPGETLKALKKESKKMRKLQSKQAEENFLINLEEMKTKSQHYGHVDANKIFTF